MNLAMASMDHSLIFENQLLTVFVPMAKGMLLIRRTRLRNLSDEVRMSLQYHWKKAGIGQELLTFLFSLSKVVQVQIHLLRSAVLHAVFGFGLFDPVFDGAPCFGEVGDEGADIWVVSSGHKGRGYFRHRVVLWDLDVFEVVVCGVGWRLPADVIMEGDLIV